MQITYIWRLPRITTIKEYNPVADLVAELVGKPYEFVMAIYPWGKKGTILENETGPDKWQKDVLDLIGKAESLETGLQLAVASGHGVGKTSLVAWIVHYFLSTRRLPNAVVTANTGIQLKTKTWRELNKWHKLSLNKDWFEWTATSYKLKDNETHVANAVTWSERNTEGFQGAHDKDLLFVMDEASAIIDTVWEVTQGAMTTPGAMWLVFGNPTRASGRFRECWGKFRHRWATMKVDSRTAKKVNLEEVNEWINDYGEDSDFVRVRIKGEFPKQAADQFIPTDLVDSAIKHNASNYSNSLKIMGCDLARFGDDQTVFCIRQGRKVFPLIKYRKLDAVEIAARIVDTDKKYKPDLIYIDLGYMPGVYDILKEKGLRHIRGVSFGASPIVEVDRYRNRRAEMWGNTLEWLKEGNCDLPNDSELKADLISPTYMLNNKDQIILESKRDMKKRGLASTDSGDALALTQAEPVYKQGRAMRRNKKMWTQKRQRSYSYAGY